jgi:Tfp pilus assembly protein PilN
MNEFLVDFLPQDLRKSGAMLASRRRNMLLTGLMTLLVVGTATHSWNFCASANAALGVAQDRLDNTEKVDDALTKRTADEQQLEQFFRTYDLIHLPLEHSDLVATVTNLLPDKVSLSKLRLTIERAEVPPPKELKSDAGKEAKPAAPMKPPARWMEVTILGFAASNTDLYDFERRLAAKKPFESVTITESKSTEVPGGRIQEFAVTARMPMRAKTAADAAAEEAAAEESGTAADAAKAEVKAKVDPKSAKPASKAAAKPAAKPAAKAAPKSPASGADKKSAPAKGGTR